MTEQETFDFILEKFRKRVGTLSDSDATEKKIESIIVEELLSLDYLYSYPASVPDVKVEFGNGIEISFFDPKTKEQITLMEWLNKKIAGYYD